MDFEPREYTGNTERKGDTLVSIWSQLDHTFYREEADLADSIPRLRGQDKIDATHALHNLQRDKIAAGIALDTPSISQQ